MLRQPGHLTGIDFEQIAAASVCLDLVGSGHMSHVHATQNGSVDTSGHDSEGIAAWVGVLPCSAQFQKSPSMTDVDIVRDSQQGFGPEPMSV